MSLLMLPLSPPSNKVLQRSSGLDETGEVVWYLALCLLLSWLIVAVALFKGIKSSGKVGLTQTRWATSCSASLLCVRKEYNQSTRSALPLFDQACAPMGCKHIERKTLR